jgi:hypothetical protein
LNKTTPTRRSYRTTACCFVVLAIVAYHNGSCFATDKDFQFWNTVEFSFKVNKDWSGAVVEQFKFGDNAGHLYYQHTDLDFTYKSLADWIDIGFNYKQIFVEQSDGNWSSENRPHFNITFKGRLGSLAFSDRSRFEYRDLEYADDLWRYVNKLEVNLPFEFTQYKFRPYIADQVYINMDGSGFEKNRIYAGINFELSENFGSELCYVWQWRELNCGWHDLDALGFQLQFRF